ncbi:Golgi membrane protein 1 isoform X2 [Spea bombifrons]|uniref:Golgi membrane protein 1 isoform X2 n=1 Tax=Spea bombifrons TaxID=233779 RepID=UPI002349F933|nr:Golgi membrane protein 1 isoform X2 [Spea bombifrons]
MGLGSGRRGMKSPPLLIAVLLACVFVLGINYWITSSRCVELQSRVLELEGRMRRAAAERGAVEMKKNEFQEKLEKQKEQIDTIQSLHSSQMQSVNSMCKSEKEALLNNITVNDKLIQNLQGQIKNLQKEFAELKESQAKKSIFELAQCTNKIKEQIEQCEERLRRATGKEQKPTISKQVTEQKDNSVKEPKQLEDNRIHDISKPSESPPKAEFPKKEEETNEVQENVDQTEKKSAPEPIPPKLEEEKKVENAPQSKEMANEDLKAENNVQENEDQEAKQANKDVNKEAENEEVEREHLLNLEDQIEDKEENQGEQNKAQEGQNDYNGDEGNEAEPEAEKQAQLIDNDQNLKVDNIKNALKGQLLDDGEDNEDPTLK